MNDYAPQDHENATETAFIGRAWIARTMGIRETSDYRFECFISCFSNERNSTQVHTNVHVAGSLRSIIPIATRDLIACLILQNMS